MHFGLQRSDFGTQRDRLLFAGGHFRPQRQQLLFQRQQQRGGGGIVVMVVAVVMVIVILQSDKAKQGKMKKEAQRLVRHRSGGSPRPYTTQPPSTYLAHGVSSPLASCLFRRVFFTVSTDMTDVK